MLSENQKAPDFKLLNEKNETIMLSQFVGKPFVLYFYPKDDSPGCTTEACSFRDSYNEYQNLGVEIIGISPDNSTSHEKFSKKYQLPFILLADPDHKVAELYGVWGKKKNYGKEYDGIFRTTFLIDREGKIAKVFKGVKPADHSIEVLDEIKKLIDNPI